MNPNKVNIDTMQELVDKLNYYTKLYDEGRPAISDKEWDDMYFQLQAWENSERVYLPDSPTQNINYQVVNKLNKVKHNHLMLSLDKTKSIDEIRSFVGDKDYICMAKLDGLTCSLRYIDGKLVSAETRGNGIEGEDVTHNAIVIKSIPNKIKLNGEVIIDGEIICTYNDFKEFENEYKNPRNFASGSIRLLDSKECANRKLSFIAWDCIDGLNSEMTLSNKLLRLSQNNFITVPYICNTDIEESIDYIKTNSYNYPIDGLVFKYDNVKEYNAAGRTDHHYKGGLSLKFYDEEYETELIDIEWSIGRTGQISPIALFKTLNIDGTEISRASLNNISVMKKTLGEKPFVGQTLLISKRNQIIPKVENAKGEDGEWIIKN